MSLCHYVFVRRDLPIGVVAAMVTHAAGESGSLYQDEYDGRFRGAIAVVLEAKDEAALKGVETYLQHWNVRAVSIVEGHGPYANQLMAIGLVPIERDKVAKLLEDYQTLKTLSEPIKNPEKSLDNDSWAV